MIVELKLRDWAALETSVVDDSSDPERHLSKKDMNDAELYTTANPMQTKDADESMRQFSRQFLWKNREKILDVGCGPGDVTASVLKKYVPEDATLVGGDISKEMVTFASAKFASSRIEFKWLDIEGQLEDGNWTPSTFDKIFSFYTFHWIQNQKSALENMFSLLKSGGQLFLIFLGNVPIFELYKRLGADEKWAPYMMDVDKYVCKYHEMIDPEESVKKSLIEAHFQNAKVHCIQKTFSYTSLDQLTRSILAVNPFLKRIPSHLIASYEQDIALHSRAMSTQNNDGIEVQYSLIVAFAEK